MTKSHLLLVQGGWALLLRHGLISFLHSYDFVFHFPSEESLCTGYTEIDHLCHTRDITFYFRPSLSSHLPFHGLLSRSDHSQKNESGIGRAYFSFFDLET